MANNHRLLGLVTTVTILGLASSNSIDISRGLGSVVTANNDDFCTKLIMAHGGASGYVPEHTLGAYALAITMGADYVEIDLVITKDGQLIARHENELSMTTDISNHSEFASRKRNQSIDGIEMNGWFTEDFTLAELKTLRAIERIPKIRPGNARMDGTFTIPTFQEIIDLVRNLQCNQKRPIGIYPEIKHSTHFQRLGLSMEPTVVQILHKNGYWGPCSPVYIQSNEVSNLQYLSKITKLKLMQLIDKSHQPADQAERGTGLTFSDMSTPEGLQEIAKYASAVGPDKTYIIPRDDNNRLGAPTSFVADCHAVGLKVHPYTFRAENYFLPTEFQSDDPSPAAIGDFESELRAYFDAGVDGLFSDQPDIAIRVRGQCQKPTE